MGRKKVAQAKKNKAVLVRLIPEASNGKTTEPYKFCRDLVKAHHSHLANARIALLWRRGWKPDKDGHLRFGQAKKASDCDRALKDYDFAILLNEAVWLELTADQRKALMDHQLCHCEVQRSAVGEIVENDEGKTVYRTRKHDVEEFTEIGNRHGSWTPNMKALIEQISDKGQMPLPGTK
jgi:hypothetical protein